MAAERKLDIFQLLRATDRRDGNWFANQSAEAQKEFAPPVVLRWAATVEGGQEGAYMLWMVNENVNVHMYDLYKHPELVYRLIASCGVGKPLKHQWIPAHKRKGGENKAFELLAKMHPDSNDRELEMLMDKYTKETFSELVLDCGFQPADAKAVMKDYDKLQ